ncbi:MAG: hypothetical protein ACK55Z_05395 [bacterium]
MLARRNGMSQRPAGSRVAQLSERRDGQHNFGSQRKQCSSTTWGRIAHFKGSRRTWSLWQRPHFAIRDTALYQVLVEHLERLILVKPRRVGPACTH